MPARHTKRRQFTVSGEDERVTISSARPHKPPAKVISQRKAAARRSGGDTLTPEQRREYERAGTPRRTQRPSREKTRGTKSTRYGRRRPERGRAADAARERARKPSGKAGTPATDRAARAIPATRTTRNEPRAGRHRKRG